MDQEPIVTTHLNARVPVELHRRLKTYARESGTQMTVLIILAIQSFLKSGEASSLPLGPDETRSSPTRERVVVKGTMGTVGGETWP